MAVTGRFHSELAFSGLLQMFGKKMQVWNVGSLMLLGTWLLMMFICKSAQHVENLVIIKMNLLLEMTDRKISKATTFMT